MTALQQSIRIPASGVTLDADIVTPEPVVGVVLFAHGSGSSRHSSRNRSVAGELQSAGFATVLADLLTPEEERADELTGRFRFDIELLSTRVTALTDWLVDHGPMPGHVVGLFGASTGAAAALVTAATRPTSVAAVVSRGGRPDLAGDLLRQVRQPTLLIVGGRDATVLDLNRGAMQLLAQARLEIVPRATHLFEEPGSLAEVARLAREWFRTHLPPPPRRT